MSLTVLIVYLSLCHFFFYLSGYHQALHVLTHSFPTRRSSDLKASKRLVERGRHVLHLEYEGRHRRGPWRRNLLFPRKDDKTRGVVAFVLEDRKSTRLNSSH